ncbi:MAG: type II secretion system GspH family protein [Gammaproteobacteria bacterium]|nr:type II secretion system GspH family protein [Gammaproteobacteria bacterium]
MLLNKFQSGLTLIELIVTLVILSILASAALPYAEVAVRRDQELELRRALREVRTAIDEFHRDWEAGRIPLTSDAASDQGYPKSLDMLVKGVDLGKVTDQKRYYLRRIPPNPLADPIIAPEQQWQLRSYQDAPDNKLWGEQDVYDIRVKSEKRAINGSYYKHW